MFEFNFYSAMTKKFDSEKQRLKIIDRIKKILNIANGSQYEAEAATALKMAQSYMKQYGLSLSDVEIDEQNAENQTIVMETVDREAGMYDWEPILGTAVAIVFEVQGAVFLKERYSYRLGEYVSYKQYGFIGYVHDVELAKLFFLQLHISVRKQASSRYRNDLLQKKSYIRGFSDNLVKRAHKEKEEARSSSEKYALVLYKKADGIENFAVANGFTGKYQERKRKIDWEAYDQGVEDSKTVALYDKIKLD